MKTILTIALLALPATALAEPMSTAEFISREADHWQQFDRDTDAVRASQEASDRQAESDRRYRDLRREQEYQRQEIELDRVNRDLHR